MSSRTVEDTLAAIDGVEGWLTPDQARRLYRAAAATRVGDTIVEIGSFRGRSTIVLASAAPGGVQVIAIDPHAGTDRGPGEIGGFEAAARDDARALTANLRAAGVDDRVRHVGTASDDAHGAVAGAIDVLFVDGAHRFVAARLDLRGWGARVRPAGTMLVHDAFSSVGVTAAIACELMAGRRFRYAGRVGSLAVYHADLDGTVRSRALNGLRQMLELGWFCRNLGVKLAITSGLGPLLRRAGCRAEWPY